MPPNDREERRRMRQRGAGTSGLSVGNFGFTFGAAPLPAQPSSRRTPKPSPPQPSSRRTPASKADPLPARRSTRKTPASNSSRRTSNALSAQRSSRKSPAPLPPKISARKTPKEQPPAAAPGSSSARASGRTQRRSRTPSQSNEQTFVTPSIIGKRKRPSVVQQVPESQEDELEQNDDEYQTSARKAQAGSARRTSGIVHATPLAITADAEDELEDNDVDHTLSSGRRPLSSLKNVGNVGATSSPRLFVSQDEPSPVPVVKRAGRPRKSIEDPDSTVAEPSSTAGKRSTRRSSQTERVHEDLTMDEAYEDDLSADELSPVASRQQLERIEEEDTESEQTAASSGDETVSQDSTPEIATSNIPPQPRPRGRPPGSKSTPAASRTRKPQPGSAAPAQKRARRRTTAAERGPRVPVTVYRISAPRKPTDDASVIDELELPTPSAVANTRLPTVNAVDILAQVTSELTARMNDSLIRQAAEAGTSDKARRAELKRRSSIVEAFSTELTDRLFELTEAVDAGEALRSRLKAAMKEKVALRSEFLGVRREREQTALRMDAVRQAHMQAEAKRRHDEELSDALYGIETAVQRGREKAVREGRQDEGPEVDTLWEIEDALSSGVSGAGPRGGLLDRVKDFNGFLEKAATVIEGRS
ncbi:at hook domain-containing protein [Diplodia corticola]|uniref:At hook domain-containing protein n=1 Tax=Diplodia corticola TaxID=236234 RepID=A0A1J9R8U2_9PEZI|nr:at hook domain-containing protein [Diplodia corticola]OJD36937.1 at hook domain-containing protein [Diplodia corticola]